VPNPAVPSIKIPFFRSLLGGKGRSNPENLMESLLFGCEKGAFTSRQ